MNYTDYFKFRQVTPELYGSYSLPPYLLDVFCGDTELKILDFGCGFGQTLKALVKQGYKNVSGVDIEPEAVTHCRQQGLVCFDGLQETTFYNDHSGEYDYVIMSHVLEHIPKESIIQQLVKIKSLIKPGGALIVMVPNAQSNTGAYWAYEDFTHHYLFTSGSLYYVLKAANYEKITFLDIDCTAGLTLYKRVLKKSLLWAYSNKYRFWNRVTTSSIHSPSPQIFSYEIKVLAHV